MRKLRPALLCSCLLAAPLVLAAGARAAETLHPGMVLYNAAGQPVGVVEPLNSAAFPATQFSYPARLLAEQTAVMRQMIADMQAFDRVTTFDFAPDRMIQAALRQLQGAGTRLPPNGFSTVTISSFTSGNGSCSQTVTYSYPGGGAQPQVAVRKVGDSCDSIAMPGLRETPAATPEPTPVNHGPRLLRVDDKNPASTTALHG